MILQVTPVELLEFVMIGAIGGWALGIATYGVVDEIERWFSR